MPVGSINFFPFAASLSMKAANSSGVPGAALSALREVWSLIL